MHCYLTNVPMVFMDHMNRVFWNYLDSFVIVFIDNILAYLKSKDKHKLHLRILLQVLMRHPLFAKYSKCEFCLPSMVFLGHIVSSACIEFDLKMTEAVKNWPRPLTLNDISSFLDLAG